MAVDFPSSPTEGQTFSAAGYTYTYRSGAWIIENSMVYNANGLTLPQVQALAFMRT